MTPSERYRSAEEMVAALLTLKIDLPQVSDKAIPLYMPGVVSTGIHEQATLYDDREMNAEEPDDATQPIEKK